MKLFIPIIGTKLVLLKPWKFQLYDEYRNEKFWFQLHGKPIRKSFYYGYNTGGYHTSPTPTATATQQSFEKADPITTIFPKGTVLFIERIYIRKGASDFDSVSFKILKGGPVPAGRFWAKLKDINGNMDADTEIVNKYPDGKFSLNVIEGNTYNCKNCNKPKPYSSSIGHPSFCNCITPFHPKYRTNVLTWMSNPEGSHWQHGKVASMTHETDETGLDNITTERRRYNSSDGYSKSFTNFQEFLDWANKKKFTDSHIHAFLTLYEEKKAEWLKERKA